MLTKFSCETYRTYDISNGESESLISGLKSIAYEGGTDTSCILATKTNSLGQELV